MQDLITPLVYTSSELEALQDSELVECVHGKRGNKTEQEMQFDDVDAVMYESQRHAFEVWMKRLQEVCVCMCACVHVCVFICVCVHEVC